MIGVLAQSGFSPLEIVGADAAGTALEGAAQASASGGESGSIWWWIAGGAAFVIVAVWAALKYGQKTGSAEHDAFLSLAWRLRLGARSRAALRKLASIGDVPAVALLVSAGAFERCVKKAQAEGQIDEGVIDRIRRRAFPSV